MKKQILISFLFLLLFSCNKNQNNKLLNFNKNEIDIFNEIKNFYKDFDYSNNYIETKEKNKKMIFKDDNEIFNKYPNLEIIFFPISKDLNYSYNFGNSYSIYGSYYTIGNDVINIEKGYGKSGYGYSISKNGKKIYEENKN